MSQAQNRLIDGFITYLDSNFNSSFCTIKKCSEIYACYFKHHQSECVTQVSLIDGEWHIEWNDSNNHFSGNEIILSGNVMFEHIACMALLHPKYPKPL
jgi:hypothetical protein